MALSPPSLGLGLRVLRHSGVRIQVESSQLVQLEGACPNAHIWDQLVTLLDLFHAQVQWIWVPSHVDIPGNEKADELADTGRNRTPLVTILPQEPPSPQAEHVCI